MVKHIFIHLDDNNQEISDAIYKVMIQAAEVDPSLVLREAQEAVGKQKHPRKCQEVIRFA
jgi:hypothetical protein